MDKDAKKQEDPKGSVPPLDFLGYITSLAFQAMVFLGEIPSPVTNKTETNILQAKFLIDILILIRDKTRGNLSSQEESMLTTTIYELEIKYVQVTQRENQS